MFPLKPTTGLSGHQNLLRFDPFVGAHQLDRYIWMVDVQRLAVRCAAVLR